MHKKGFYKIYKNLDFYVSKNNTFKRYIYHLPVELVVFFFFLISQFLQWYCEGGYCESGRKIIDYGCVLTDVACGINMKFITVEIGIPNESCIQMCS